jgi:hypothetical protein
MLQPDPNASTFPVAMNDESLAIVKELASLPTEELFRRWITDIGLDDLSQSLQLYVGESP